MLNDRVVGKIPYFFLFLLSFYPLMKTGLASVTAILFLISTIIVYRSNFPKRLKEYGHKPFLVNCGFYIILLISILYSDNMFVGFKKMQASLLILFFPIVFLYFFPKVNSKTIYYILCGFVFSNFVLLLYFFNILVEGLEIDRFANLTRTGLMDQLKALNTYPYEFVLSKAEKHLNVEYESHKVYVSIHFLVAMIMAGQLLFRHNLQIATKILLGILLVFFGVAIVYSQAITSVLAMVIVLLSFPFVALKGYKLKGIYLIGISIICALGWYIGLSDTYKNKNTASVLKLFESITKNESLEEGTDKRMYVYDCCLTLIRKKALFGYGVGNVQKRLTKCYNDKKYIIAEFKSAGIEINSHNYYLNVWLSAGIAALLALLWFFLHSSHLAFATDNYAYLFFLIVIALSLLTENILVRMSGVFLFAIFNSLFYSISTINGESEK